MILCTLNQAGRQLPKWPRIEPALKWLRSVVAGENDVLSKLGAMTPGTSQRIAIDGDEVFANLMCYETTPILEKLESHRAYCDIQYIHRGVEGLAWADFEQLAVLEPYDAAMDAAFYPVADDVIIKLPFTAGNVAFIFPCDAHGLGFTIAPQGSSERIEKIVIKVAL